MCRVCAQNSWTLQWIRGKKLYKYCSVSCIDRLFVNYILSVYDFFFLKAMGPIDCHYMTDRLQRFELKIFVCVPQKKRSHLHLGYPGGEQDKHHIFNQSNGKCTKCINVKYG